ncbi:MAG: response regulator [Akkermansiaceae bacterium]|nr:response regulator [Akkermansiaceae bacterium]MCP5546673.1 response regulator [Akkermansiaceae bacterium]
MRRVLIVDDEPTLRLGFSYALQSQGTCVDTASGGASALELAGENRYDALFLDLRMPDVDGLRVIEGLRDAGNHVPVVLCSAYITLESALAAIRRGVVDFLIKPVSPADLRHAFGFVTGGASTPLAKALALAREKSFGDAVSILEEGGPRDVRTELWLRLLRHVVRGDEAPEVRAALGDKIAEQVALRSDAA